MIVQLFLSKIIKQLYELILVCQVCIGWEIRFPKSDQLRSGYIIVYLDAKVLIFADTYKKG